MKNEHALAIQQISAECANYALSPLMDMIHKGEADIQALWVQLDMDQYLEKLMHKYWEQLVDTTNAYWNLHHITEEDRSFVLIKLKNEVEPQFKSALLDKLVMKMEELARSLEDQYQAFRRDVELPLGDSENNLDRLKQLRTGLNQLMDQAIKLEKWKIYLSAHHVSMEGNMAQMIESVEGYKLERKLRGGVVTGVNPQGVYLPEGEIRNLGAEHGNLLRLVRTYTKEEQTRYEFAIADKRSEPQPERIQLDFCLVSLDEGNQVYYTDTFAPDLVDQEIMSDGKRYRITIKEEDMKHFKIEAGDRVDIAYWFNNISGAKVIWKHLPESNVRKSLRA